MSWKTVAGAAALAEGKGLFVIHENVLIAISDENEKRLVAHVGRISEAGHVPIIICEGSTQRAVEVFGKVPNVTIFGDHGNSKWIPGNNGAGSYVRRGGVGDFRKWIPRYIRDLAPKAIFVANTPWDNPQPGMDNFLSALDLTGRLVAKIDVASAPHRAPARVLIEEFRALQKDIKNVRNHPEMISVMNAVRSGQGRIVLDVNDVSYGSDELKTRLDRLARAGNDVWVVGYQTRYSRESLGISPRIRLFGADGQVELEPRGFSLSLVREDRFGNIRVATIADRLHHEGPLPTLIVSSAPKRNLVDLKLATEDAGASAVQINGVHSIVRIEPGTSPESTYSLDLQTLFFSLHEATRATQRAELVGAR